MTALSRENRPNRRRSRGSPRLGSSSRAARTLRNVASLALLGALGAACYTSSDGLEPPLDTFYFPTGIAVSPGRTALYVTNSDFDLQYNGGTVQALDLTQVRSDALGIEAALQGRDAAGACGSLGLGTNPTPVTVPGPCAPFEARRYIRKAVSIGAFASGIALAAREDAPGVRLFIPVRGDPSVTYLDVTDDRPGAPVPACGPFCLECASSGDDARCGPQHRVGQDAEQSSRGLRLPVEPVSVATSDGGASVVTPHLTEASVSLVVNRWDGGQRPSLEFVLQDLPDAPSDIAAIPRPGFVRASAGAVQYEPGFAVSYRGAATLDLLRYVDDRGSSPPRAFLQRVDAAPITTNAGGRDSRAIAVDDSQRAECETACGAADLACLRECLDIPLRVFATNRSPASLLVGEIEATVTENDSEVSGEPKSTSVFEEARIYDAVPLAIGPAGLALGRVIDKAGKPALRVFAVSFDSRLVFVYDPEARAVETVIRTGRGPQAIAFDTGEIDGKPYSLLLVGHFLDSYVGVVSLDATKPATYGAMIASVGVPSPPKELLR